MTPPPPETTPGAAPPRVPSGTRTWLERGWWLWLSLLWIVTAAVFAAQIALLGGMPWAYAIRAAAADWGLWLPLSPLVLWLARRAQISARTWRWTLPLHVLAAIAVAVVFEINASLFPLRGPEMTPGPMGLQAPGGPAPAGSSNPGGKTRAGAPPAGWGPPGGQPQPGSWDDADRDGGGPMGPPPGGDRTPAPGAPGGGMPLPGDAREPGPRTGINPQGSGRARLALPVYFLLVAASHALAYHRRSLDRERRALTAEAQLAEARLMALQTQLQPHFFFNALNAVAALVHTRPDEADAMICALGELMRGVLDLSGRREISLGEELAFADRYLAVEQIRFRERLRIVRDLDAAALDCAVPALLLQPLVENAVVHGVAHLRQPATITLRARRTDGHVIISVANPTLHPDRLVPQPGGRLAFSDNVGLANTRERLATVYGRDFRFEHLRSPQGEVIAEIQLPYRPCTAPPA